MRKEGGLGNCNHGGKKRQGTGATGTRQNRTYRRGCCQWTCWQRVLVIRGAAAFRPPPHRQATSPQRASTHRSKPQPRTGRRRLRPRGRAGRHVPALRGGQAHKGRRPPHAACRAAVVGGGAPVKASMTQTCATDALADRRRRRLWRWGRGPPDAGACVVRGSRVSSVCNWLVRAYRLVCIHRAIRAVRVPTGRALLKRSAPAAWRGLAMRAGCRPGWPAIHARQSCSGGGEEARNGGSRPTTPGTRGADSPRTLPRRHGKRRSIGLRRMRLASREIFFQVSGRDTHST